MKLILILCLFSFSLYSETTCKYKIESDTIYGLSLLNNSSYTNNQGEIESDGFIYGDLDPYNAEIVYWDDTSPICGGTGNSNILIAAMCLTYTDSCFEISQGMGETHIVIQKDGKYTNNVIIANYWPCLPRGVKNITVGYFDYDNNDIGLANLNLDTIVEEGIFELTEEEARLQREKCPNIKNYVDDWENILSSQQQSLNGDITSIKYLNFDLLDYLLEDIKNALNIEDNNNSSNETTYEEITINFNSNNNLDITNNIIEFDEKIQTTLLTTFDTYSNVFGFSDYGNAPTPIKFNLLGRTYSALDFSLYEEHIPMIRNTFIAFAYVWGFILVVKGFKNV